VLFRSEQMVFHVQYYLLELIKMEYLYLKHGEIKNVVMKKILIILKKLKLQKN